MEIIRFEVKNSISFKSGSIHLKFEPGYFIIKAENGRAYFNEESLLIITNHDGDEIKNVSRVISFMSFDEGIAFHTNINNVEENSNLLEMCRNYINSISDVTEDELKDLLIDLQEFNNNNLIDYSLDIKNEEMFMELTATLKRVVFYLQLNNIKII